MSDENTCKHVFRVTRFADTDKAETKDFPMGADTTVGEDVEANIKPIAEFIMETIGNKIVFETGCVDHGMLTSETWFREEPWGEHDMDVPKKHGFSETEAVTKHMLVELVRSASRVQRFQELSLVLGLAALAELEDDEQND